MYGQIRQSMVMISTALASLPQRLAMSASMVVTVALVVCVLSGFLALAKGFQLALAGAGSPDVAVLLGGGSTQEAGSDVPADAIRRLSAMTGDFGVARDPEGRLVSSREIVVAVDAKPPGEGAPRALALRGMDPAGPSLRDGLRLSDGRLFTPGSREIVVGDRLARQYGLGLGDTVRLGAIDWTVAGHFSAHGSAFESEIWADFETVRAMFDREGHVQSLKLRLTDPAAIARLRDKVTTIAGTPLTVLSEADLYAAQSGRVASLIHLFGWPIAVLMAVGATAGALNTMMSSVSQRTAEIATVRALGFSRLSAFLGTWVEAMALACMGVALGLCASWLVFNGWQARTMGANNAQIAFQLAVTPDVLIRAALLGLAVGVLGGAVPAMAAARLPLTAALRARS